MGNEGKYKIVVDYDLCEANALCQVEAPAIFEIDNDENLIVHEDKAVPGTLQEAQRAAARCPKSALRIVPL